MKLLPVSTFEHYGIKNVRSLGNNLYSGAALDGMGSLIKNLKDEFNIKTIIDFRGLGESRSNIATDCIEKEMNYINFAVGHTRNGLSGGVGVATVSDEYISQLKSFINAYNEGNAYMGCQYGIDRTNLALTLNYLLNPKATAPEILTWGNFNPKSVINRTLKIARKLIKRMTPEQKAEFNLPEDYNTLFQSKVKQLLQTNMLYG